MLNEKLKIGDYVTDGDGNLYRIDRINKASYHASPCGGMAWQHTVPFSGIVNEYGATIREFFPCSDEYAQILKKLGDRVRSLEDEVAELSNNCEALNNLKKNLQYLMEVDLCEEIADVSRFNYDDEEI